MCTSVSLFIKETGIIGAHKMTIIIASIGELTEENTGVKKDVFYMSLETDCF